MILYSLLSLHVGEHHVLSYDTNSLNRERKWETYKRTGNSFPSSYYVNFSYKPKKIQACLDIVYCDFLPC